MIKLITAHSETPVDRHGEALALLKNGWQILAYNEHAAAIGFRWSLLLHKEEEKFQPTKLTEAKVKAK